MRFSPIVRAAQFCIYFAQLIYFVKRPLHKMRGYRGFVEQSSNWTSYHLSMLEHLTTEARNPASEDLDGLSAAEIVALINAECAKVAAVVVEQSGVIAQAIDVIADRVGRGGRLIYFGAATSCRLGFLNTV